jgi:hypothetical protein
MTATTKSYTAYFRTDSEWAEEEFKADTPEQALALARAFYDDHTEELAFQGYDGGMPVTEIEISGDEGDEIAVWQDDDLRLRLAAGSLLDACKVALERLELNNCEGEEQAFIELLQAAIRDAQPAGSN